MLQAAIHELVRIRTQRVLVISSFGLCLEFLNALVLKYSPFVLKKWSTKMVGKMIAAGRKKNMEKQNDRQNDRAWAKKKWKNQNDRPKWSRTKMIASSFFTIRLTKSLDYVRSFWWEKSVVSNRSDARAVCTILTPKCTVWRPSFIVSDGSPHFSRGLSVIRIVEPGDPGESG